MRAKKNNIFKGFCLSVVAGILVIAAGIPVHAATSKQIKGISHYDYAYKAMELTNVERVKRGKKALTFDTDIVEASMIRAAELAVKFDHTRPNGKDCFTICDKIYAENMAYGQESSEEVIADWVHSKAHRISMLNERYQSVGVGAFEYDGTIYWIQSFGKVKGKDSGEPESGETVYQISLSKSVKTKVISGAQIKPKDPLAIKVGGFKAKAGKKKLTLSWSKKKGIDGFEVQVSNKKSFKNADTYTLKKGKKKLVIKKFKGKKLKSKKKYYMRIRAFKKTAVVSNDNSTTTADTTTTTDTTSADTDVYELRYVEKNGYAYSYTKWNDIKKKTR